MRKTTLFSAIVALTMLFSQQSFAQSACPPISNLTVVTVDTTNGVTLSWTTPPQSMWPAGCTEDLYFRFYINGQQHTSGNDDDALTSYTFNASNFTAGNTYQLGVQIEYWNDDMDLLCNADIINVSVTIPGSATVSCPAPYNLSPACYYDRSVFLLWTLPDSAAFPAGCDSNFVFKMYVGDSLIESIASRNLTIYTFPSALFTVGTTSSVGLQIAYLGTTDTICTSPRVMETVSIAAYPTVTAHFATHTSHDSTVLSATIVTTIDVIGNRGFEWRKTADPDFIPISLPYGDNNYKYTLHNLTPSTDYTFRAYIVFNDDTIRSAEKTFVTMATPVPSTVTTHEAESIEATSAILKGSMVLGTDNVTEKGFEWRKTQEAAYTSVSIDTPSDHFSYLLNGLEANNSYTFRAYILANNVRLYGADKTFHSTVNIETVSETQAIQLYPNPVSVRLYFDVAESAQNITIVNAQGKQMFSLLQSHKPFSIDVSTWEKGMYLLQYQTRSGKQTQKFIKE